MSGYCERWMAAKCKCCRVNLMISSVYFRLKKCSHRSGWAAVVVAMRFTLDFTWLEWMWGCGNGRWRWMIELMQGMRRSWEALNRLYQMQKTCKWMSNEEMTLNQHRILKRGSFKWRLKHRWKTDNQKTCLDWLE